MKTVSTLAVAAALTLGLVASAAAQSFAPTVPNPANPTPANPIATDGSPLPAGDNVLVPGLQTGRSVFAPVGGFVDTFVGR